MCRPPVVRFEIENCERLSFQELSRILFSAVEQSLVGTEGCHLVKDLYHGSIVNQITCQTCGRCSERQVWRQH